MIAKAKISATAVAVAVAAGSSAPRRSTVRPSVRPLRPVRSIVRTGAAPVTVLKEVKSRKLSTKALSVESLNKSSKTSLRNPMSKPMALSGTAHTSIAGGQTAALRAQDPEGLVAVRKPAVVRSIEGYLGKRNIEARVEQNVETAESYSTRHSSDVESNIESIDARFHEQEEIDEFEIEIPVLDEKAARKAQLKLRAAELASDQKDPVLQRRDQVVLEHLPLVKAIAVRVHENLPVHVDLDDLVHAGVLGLFDAASKFNPEKQVAFSSYAKHRIKGAILDSLRQLDWASRDMRRRHKQLEAATRELAATLQRNPTEAEIAEKLGMDPERWRSMMLDLRNVGLISASTRANENEDLPAPDFPTKPETHPDSICSLEQLRGVLGVAIKTLPERYQKVVSLYYSGEMTMKEIGGVLGINESRVSQIHKSALEKMQVVLQSNGIRSAQAF